MDSVHLALDFGSASGRLVAGKFNGERLKLQEIHRFPNQPVRFNGRLYWDFLRLFHEMMTGLKKASRLGLKVESIGTDTWGVDYAFLDKQGFLLGDLIHYRDDRGNGMLEEIKKDTSVSLADIYEVTGIHYMTLNSLFQLYYDVKYRPHIVEKADALLFLPDLFTYGLTGEKYNEYTIASTSQMLDARKKIWAAGLLEKLGLPVHLLQKLIEPGTICGMLAKPIQAEVGLPAIPVIAVGSHDTASAVAATPLQSKNSAYLSSGSWSLFGVELTEPLINQKSSKHNFTNEGGVEGTIRYLKNITGLWIIQQLKKKWSAADPTIDYSWISREAQKAQTECAIAPDHEDFLAPYDMEKAILDYCRDEFGQNLRGRAEIARSVYNGIATEYKKASKALEDIFEQEIDCINIVGGGVHDQFLCQLTADITNKTVLAGPVEASVTGNILMQLKALGKIGNLAEGRELVKRSFSIREYWPKNDHPNDDRR